MFLSLSLSLTWAYPIQHFLSFLFPFFPLFLSPLFPFLLFSFPFLSFFSFSSPFPFPFPFLFLSLSSFPFLFSLPFPLFSFLSPFFPFPIFALLPDFWCPGGGAVCPPCLPIGQWRNFARGCSWARDGWVPHWLRSSCAFQCGYSISNANLYTSDCWVKDITANKNKTI